LCGLFDSFLVRQDLVAFTNPAQPGAVAKLPVHKPAKLQVIGQNQIGQRLFVALQLAGILCLIQGLAKVFGLHITNGKAIPAQDEIRCAALYSLWFVGSTDPWVERFDQILKSRTMSVFCRPSRLEFSINFRQIRLDNITHRLISQGIWSSPRR
jgi:hypothetical protein